MQQRRLRLGDILDDYCPRERRVTNHAVVAKVDDDVKLTRCMTCDTEHEYKQGKAPTLRKKKDAVTAAYQEVLAGVTREAAAPSPALDETPRVEPEAEGEAVRAAEPPEPDAAPEPPQVVVPLAEPVRAAAPAETRQGEEEEGADDSPDGSGSEEGRVHRRLIRAQLPRPENQQVVRPIPQFTMRQPTGRAGKFRPSPGRGARPQAGARAGAGHGAARSFSPRAAAQGTRPGRADGQRARGGQSPRHGKKHSK